MSKQSNISLFYSSTDIIFIKCQTS